ncbi:MSMEG_6728 family protein [Amnibacterium endophyticum]|uniref:MSMEG_6728 family protein n=1 Tax=Amnibacterium endophyticum TaxID=2109337 RepID=A0ABW4LE64_9MICO
MQTFLPSADFAESAASLDSARLGKQRVETLQILRALVLPTYGWQRHPAVTMWRGHVPALTAYGLAVVDEWRERGNADAVREQLLEFAPEVAGRSQQRLAVEGLMPDWLGDFAVHESHRSKLIAKDPGFYLPRFPGTPLGLDYVWPEGVGTHEAEDAHELWVLRVPFLEPWRAIGMLGLPDAGPRGATAAWRTQLRSFEDELVPGVVLGVSAEDDARRVHLAEVAGPAAPATIDGTGYTAVAAEFTGLAVQRRALPTPAALQNPRRFFRVPLPVPVGDLVTHAEDLTE